MIRLFPFERHRVSIDLPRQIIIDELMKYIQLRPYSIFFKNEKSKPFHGSIVNGAFTLGLKINYMNSFKPEVKMTINERQGQSEMIFEFRVLLIVRVFVVLFSIFTVLLIVLSTNFFSSFDEGELIPLGIIAFSFVFMYMGFYMTYEITVDEINRILNKIRAVSKKS